jgi:hypothetical protein
VKPLEKRTAGDWFEVRERLRHPRELYEHLCPADREGPHREIRTAALREVVAALEGAVEGGVFEVRRHLAGEILGELAEAEYSSEVLGRLEELACRGTALVLVTALERALLSGDLAFEDGESIAEPDGSIKKDIENAQINEIIGDIKEIIAADPAAKMNSAIKNVLLQVQKYREEAATFKKLKEQANDYRLEMYTKTFSASFRQIFESIRKNYGAYLEEMEEKRRAAAGSPLDGLEVRPWLRVVTAATEDVSRLRSTVSFAAEEHSGMRGALVALAKERDTFIGQIAEEQEAAVKVCVAAGADDDGGRGAGDRPAAQERAARLSRMMSREIAGHLRKWMEE